MGKVTYTVAKLKAAQEEMLAELGKRIIGQTTAIKEVLTALFAGGHCMITGMPGVAKTLLVSCLSEVMDLEFKRIQFTPDLMPSDIIGTEILEEDRTTGRRELQFVRGPVFANVVMADEINRTPPKTQAALLESMQEKQVSIGGKTHPLKEPFFVLATQIPMEQEGTYPLPEAQQDRFMFNVTMTYLSEFEEVAAVRNSSSGVSPRLNKILDGKDLLEYQKLIRDIPVPKVLGEYIVDLVSSSRPGESAPDFINEYVAWGAGLRASQYIALGAKARAGLSGRTEVEARDIRPVITPVMRHRIGLNFRADVDKVTVEDLIERLVTLVPVPAEAASQT
ncbi:MAG TPA: AAA family ATPase [Planctomycetota bacterium]|nr:AAA family ATPase [Planctomycetota bacterium]